MSCTVERWPQDRANVACFTSTGELKWIRYWDPMSEISPASPPSTQRVCVAVTEGAIAVIYRETSTDDWYISSIRNRDGARDLLHEPLGINLTLTNVQIGVTPLRSEVQISVLNPGAGTATVHNIQGNGAVTTGTSNPESGGGSVVNLPIVMPNGEMVSLATVGSPGSGGMLTVVVTDQSGEVWRATEFAEVFDGPSYQGIAIEDSTASGVLYFISATGGDAEDPLWEWWKVDSVAQTVAITGVVGASFTPPTNPGKDIGFVAKGSANKVWLTQSSALGTVVELRDIADDDGDVLLTIVPSNFDVGANTFDTLSLSSGVVHYQQNPGRLVDASGRFYVGARDPGNNTSRLLSCTEGNVRRFSEIKDAATFANPVILSDGLCVFDAGWGEEASPTQDANGNTIDVKDIAEAFTPGGSTLDTEWRWNGQESFGGRSLSWLTDEGDVILFEFPTEASLSNPTFRTRYTNRGTRILDVTRDV